MSILRSERLTLRPYESSDVDFVWDMYSRWEVQRYLGRSPRVMADREEAADRVRVWSEVDHPVHGIWLVAETATGTRLGTALLKELPASGTGDPSGDVEVGWHLHPDAWGRGVASEAAAAVLEHASRQGLERVLAVVYPENEASQRVAQRIGMRPLGLTRAYYDVECLLFTT
ncbi:MAG: GNAT family N-acetyltransferase [Marmoricola sp.]